MHGSFKRLTDDADHVMNDKINIFSKIVTHVKKTTAFLSGVILDATNLALINFRGYGYEMLHLMSSPASSNYSILFSYPKIEGGVEFDKHMRNLISLIGLELDFKVKYFYDQVSISLFEVSNK